MSLSYLPHTEQDRKAMLAAIGVEKTEDLFADVPPDLLLNRPLNLPETLAEPDLAKHLAALAGANANLQEYTCFLGAGAYDHYIPSVIDHILRRSEFYTAYTPYQPEISQGYLQALWEYQTLIAELTGMEASNSSLYDGGTALAEAAMLAANVNGRKEFLVAKTVHPHYRAILNTYALDRGYQLREIGYQDGVLDVAEINSQLDKTVAAVIIQSPNFFGCIENVKAVVDVAHSQGVLVIAAVDPISLGILEAPGKLGVDIAVGEGQSLGIPLSFGGPYLGFFATTEKLMRKIPGRIVGQTVDSEGNRGFVLTLQAREQHIRREKATSNICSNEALCALAVAIYLNTVGKDGFQQVASLSLYKAHYAYKQLIGLKGVETVFVAPFFKEFALRLNRPIAEVNKELLDDKIIGGLDLGRYYPELKGCALFSVTEKRSRQEIDRLTARLGAIL
ncbi:putative glycine dehydrogenase (decarboxylating) subunit 1 [Sporomusa ovata DSM 2662]|uniref:Probable glycine dehydrogenase (decarboxylating) subunit 1 n=1 Tax=Sporomusa ovata TaxID=2378 RepID=A0A0U1L232_9FIRM|nr:aminomethyl-transferring glycine dehydrogenase subunit GcvPA [Sporomusa ovata]EQB25178.1 glycine dehydrogenase subunit 1 [Sporomusa ovata DSM 2662]CQR73737.1 Glycine dehydrogenase [decarboxylating] (glycine cleavage system P1 protein) [Sporomusa ovata]